MQLHALKEPPGISASHRSSSGVAVIFPPEDDSLLRVRHLIGLAIRRRWDSGILTRDPDGAFSAFLGPDHIERLLQPRLLTDAHTPIEDHPFDPHTPLGSLAIHLDLQPSEADLLAVLLACETDPVAGRLVTYLGGNQERFLLSVDLILEIVYRPRHRTQSAAAAQLHRDLSPHRLLRRLRLITIDEPDGRGALAQIIHLPERMRSWLLGQQALDAQLKGLAQLRTPDNPPGECDQDSLATAISAMHSDGRILLIEGPPYGGQEMLLDLVASRLHHPVLLVSGHGLSPDLLVAAFREACLQSALLVITHADEALAHDGMLRLQESLEVFPASIALIGAGAHVPQLSAVRPTTAIRLTVPPFADRLRLWHTHLGDDSGLSADELREVAAIFNLGIAGIHQACTAAREVASFAGTAVQRSHIIQAVRRLFDADLSTVATRVEVTQTWDDLVLPEEVGESVAAIIQRVRSRCDVLGDWGFARKLGKGLGLTMLFSGEPGTGKSMLAGLIAAELGLDLYVVDLSRITSKWLGETEKNLARAFDAAEAGHVLLLFDEADSVLGKRSADIRSANDRHANLETNFILARLEQFQGIAIFTTNLPSAIDPAVARRMSVHVNLPYPDIDTRAELWRRMLPGEAPLGEDVDFFALAARYELSGGFIRNIVLRAAYAASYDGTAICMRHLEQAAELEYRERGSLFAGGRLG